MATSLSVLQAADEFDTLLGKLHARNLPEFFELIEERIQRERSGRLGTKQRGAEASIQEDVNTADLTMRSIASEVRAHPCLPPDAVVKSEMIRHPILGEFAKLDPVTLVSVDKFLYEDDEAIDEMCDEGMLSRNYCLECGSHRNAPLNFISHSASLQQLKFIFQRALPDLVGKTVIDIGSRLGPVLYGAYFYSGASRIVGIEINPELCAIQEDVLKKFRLSDRIQLVNKDVCTQAALLQEADVVIMHNVFEFFAPSETQISIWKFLRKTLKKKGCLLVTIPSLAQSMATLKLSIDLSSWLKQRPLDHITMWVCEEEAKEEMQQICLYEIL